MGIGDTSRHQLPLATAVVQTGAQPVRDDLVGAAKSTEVVDVRGAEIDPGAVDRLLGILFDGLRVVAPKKVKAKPAARRR